MSILEVENLCISFPTRTGHVQAVRNVSFCLGQERLAIVGESGSGKSQTGRAIMGLTPTQAQISARRLSFSGCNLLELSETERQKLRGQRMAMILQDPKYSLNPVMSIGHQIMESLRAHQRLPRIAARQCTLDMLADVAIHDPERVFDLYPHQLSGGMGQRAMIAMMLICRPQLLIADEPTSALDVTVQLEILAILDRLVAERGMGLIFISHDLRLVSSFCDRVLVMYAGRIVEEVAAVDMHHAKHPYTQGLLNCLPGIGTSQHPLPTLTRQEAWTR